MKYMMRKNAAIAAVLATTLVGWAQATQASCVNPESTNASSVLFDQGSGAWSCGSFTGRNNLPMKTKWQTGGAKTQNGITVDVANQVVTWSVNSGSDVDVDLVALWRGTGTKCHYHYSEVQTGGTGLKAPQNGNPVNVAICADDVANAGQPLEPEADNIVTTAGDSCAAQFVLDESLSLNPGVSLGFTLKENGDEEIAICAGGTTAEQIECLPNPPRISGFDKNHCAEYVSVSALLPGELPLSCAPVEYETQTGAKYCWYYENQVCDSASQDVNDPFRSLWDCGTTRRTDGTFRPKTEIGGIDFSVTVFDGSTTYTTCTRSRCWVSR